jgi:hypothetical protein
MLPPETLRVLAEQHIIDLRRDAMPRRKKLRRPTVTSNGAAANRATVPTN